MNLTPKPLFIPLKTEWFRAFEDRKKDTEYRAYGPRWNEKTCVVGRSVTVSHGYSGSRLYRTVKSFTILPRSKAPKSAREIYPNADRIAAIELA